MKAGDSMQEGGHKGWDGRREVVAGRDSNSQDQDKLAEATSPDGGQYAIAALVRICERPSFDGEEIRRNMG
jgi:hypothetical protein